VFVENHHRQVDNLGSACAESYFVHGSPHALRLLDRGLGLYELCAEEGQFLRFEQTFGRFLRFTHIWIK
jgi:hypothetical protein